jgi:FkbM family methyltransferase
LCTLKALELLRQSGRQPRRKIEFRSQCGEDAVIWDALAQPLDGFYIEVGAFDGYNYSATYALDCIGWSGLLVEPIPERARQCRERRPDARVVHAALGRRDAAGSTAFCITDDQFGGMLSHLHADSRNARKMEGTSKRTVTVPLTSMNELLKSHAGDIDAVVLDVEDTETDVLDGFDLDRFRPKLMIIEDETTVPETAISMYMSRAPYTQSGWIGFSRVYLRSDLAREMAPRLSR